MLQDVSLVRKPTEPSVADVSTSDQYSLQLRDQEKLIQLLPVAAVQMTRTTAQAAQVYQSAQLLLGPVASAPMICRTDCPDAFKASCILHQNGIAPVGQRCPWEQQYVSQRFLSWMAELERTLDTLLESERSAISTLVNLDLQERRCAMILAQAQNASLVSRSVRDVDVESGTPIAWEDVIHINAQRLNEIVDKRRALLRDLELTPEMKTRRKKALGIPAIGNMGDLASRQSSNTDRLRALQRKVKQVPPTTPSAVTPGSQPSQL